MSPLSRIPNAWWNSLICINYAWSTIPKHQIARYFLNNEVEENDIFKFTLKIENDA